jgi:carotene biosynthesis associated membrane protein
VLAVVLFAGASVAHAGAARGPGAAAALVLVAGGGGLVAEAVGVATGWPFGEYAYTDSLGAQVLGVPLLVPAAWVMMAYPALLVARRLAGAHGRIAVALVAAVALASWDVFLDPQMVEAGHWVWRHPTPSLPGVAGIPLTNFAGWLLVALVLGAVLDRVLPDPSRGDVPGRAPLRSVSVDDRLPVALYLWTYASSVMAAAVFFGRPSVALVGGVLMGLVAVPLMVTLRRHGMRRP